MGLEFPPSTSRGSSLSKWKFFHVALNWGTLGSLLSRNLTPNEALLGHVCPFIHGAPYATTGDAILNPRAFLQLRVFGSERPIDASWPPLKGTARPDASIIEYFEENKHSCSTQAFEAAQLLIESGSYEDTRRQILSKYTPNFVFMVSVLGDPEVDRIYAEVVKPKLQARGFQISRADEIRRPGLITQTITEAIASARFVVADLTNVRPNSYYELGYAHALGKPGVIIARYGTERHFDVAGYRWNYWKDAESFGSEFDAEIGGVVQQLASEGAEPSRK